MALTLAGVPGPLCAILRVVSVVFKARTRAAVRRSEVQVTRKNMPVFVFLFFFGAKKKYQKVYIIGNIKHN